MKLFSYIGIFSIIVSFVLGFCFIVGFSGWKSKENIPNQVQISKKTPTPIILKPPIESVTGILSDTKGLVEKIPWDITSTVPATQGAILYQGDEILTKENSAAGITFSEIFSCKFGEKTNILLGNLLLHSITIQQKSGSLVCSVYRDSSPVSFRISGALLELQAGIVSTNITEETIRLSIASGSGTLAFLTNDNRTGIWKLEKNDTVSIDRSTNRLTTSGDLLSSE